MSRRLALRTLLAVVLLVSFVSPRGSGVASAHVVMGKPSLHLRVAESPLVVRARVLDPQVMFVSSDRKTRRRLIDIEILETIKGTAATKKVRVVHDGHEAPSYDIGNVGLFFLKPIEKSRELRALRGPKGPSHVSGQEHDEAFLTDTAHGEILRAAVKGYADSESAASSDARVELLRDATLALLTSGDSKLGAAALASLVLAPHAALIRPSDMERLERLIADSDVSIGLRAGLLAELERRQLLDGPSHWLTLLENTPRADLPKAIRAAAAHQSPRVEKFLLNLISERQEPRVSTTVAAEAAIALGRSRNHEVVEALRSASMNGALRLRYAAIRGLGQISGPRAHAALDGIAIEHSDPDTRRRAAAELRSRSKRTARKGSPSRSDRDRSPNIAAD